MARVRSGDNEPSPRAHREAVRDVIRHCIYAVDKNPLAVDLCKVALWIESHTAGLPLSFLDHHVRRGDALIGVMDLDVLRDGIPDAAYKPLTGDDKAIATELRKRNKVEREDALQQHADIARLESFGEAMAELDAMPEDGIADIVAKNSRYRALHDDNEPWSRMKQACDLYCAAFFRPKTPATARTVPTAPISEMPPRDGCILRWRRTC